jgi:hypothetical protein
MTSTFDHCRKSPLLACGNHGTELSMSILHGWIFWEMASALCWKIHCGVQCAHLLFNGNNTCCMCLVVITLQSLFVYSACMDILGNGIISHFGVYSAHLLYNGNNSCCLCLAYILRFIYKHQLPIVLEDSTAKNPLICGNHMTDTLWVYCMLGTLLENSLWCIKCTFAMQWQQYLLHVCVLLSILW